MTFFFHESNFFISFVVPGYIDIDICAHVGKSTLSLFPLDLLTFIHKAGYVGTYCATLSVLVPTPIDEDEMAMMAAAARVRGQPQHRPRRQRCRCWWVGCCVEEVVGLVEVDGEGQWLRWRRAQSETIIRICIISIIIGRDRV